MLENLKTLRRQKGLTLKELAQIIGVGESTISLYEKGTRSPSYENLLKLSEYFGVSVDYLLGNSKEQKGFIISKRAKPFKSDKGTRINIMIDSKNYDFLSSIAHENGRTLEDEIRIIILSVKRSCYVS